LSGNVVRSTNGFAPDDFKLTRPLPAAPVYDVETDFGGNVRTYPVDAGAWEYAER